MPLSPVVTGEIQAIADSLHAALTVSCFQQATIDPPMFPHMLTVWAELPKEPEPPPSALEYFLFKPCQVQLLQKGPGSVELSPHLYLGGKKWMPSEDAPEPKSEAVRYLNNLREALYDTVRHL